MSTLPERTSADEHVRYKYRGLHCQNGQVLTNTYDKKINIEGYIARTDKCWRTRTIKIIKYLHSYTARTDGCWRTRKIQISRVTLPEVLTNMYDNKKLISRVTLPERTSADEHVRSFFFFFFLNNTFFKQKSPWLYCHNGQVLTNNYDITLQGLYIATTDECWRTYKIQISRVTLPEWTVSCLSGCNKGSTALAGIYLAEDIYSQCFPNRAVADFNAAVVLASFPQASVHTLGSAGTRNFTLTN